MRKQAGERADEFFRQYVYPRFSMHVPYSSPVWFVKAEREWRKHAVQYYHFVLLQRGCKIPLERWRPWKFGPRNPRT